MGLAAFRRRGAYPFDGFLVRGVLLLGGALLGGALVVGRRPMRLEVRGHSMVPALRPGERVLVLRRATVRRGDIVAFRHPTIPGLVLLKRLVALPGGSADLGEGRPSDAGGGYLLLGDNPARSTDSRHFGAVGRRLLIGRAVYRYAPAQRRGVLGVARTPNALLG